MTEQIRFQVAMSEGKPFEFIRTGKFKSRSGTWVEITDAMLDTLVRTFDGERVFIDIEHDLGQAAGWISKIERVGDRLIAVPDWNELGRSLVGEKLYRYVSATINSVTNTLISISLTNIPAVKGLSPVELEGVEKPERPDVVYLEDEEVGVIDDASSEGAQEQAGVYPTEDVTTGESVQSDVVLAATPGTNITFNIGQTSEMSQEREQMPSKDQIKEEEETVVADPVVAPEDDAPAEDVTPDVELSDTPATPATPATPPKSAGAAGAEYIQGLTQEMRDAAMKEFREDFKASMAEMLQEASRERKAMLAQFRAEMKEDQDLAEFSAQITGEGKNALPVSPETLMDTIKSIPSGSTREKVMSLLSTIHESGTVDFSEIGTQQGEPIPVSSNKQELPSEITTLLESFISDGLGDVGAFFELNSELGSEDDYDLHRFDQADE